MAKPRPSTLVVEDEPIFIVLIPTTCPYTLMSGPPELPLLSAAFVWMSVIVTPSTYYIAVDGRDDAVGQRAAQLHAERVADGVHRIADGQRVRVAEFRGGKAAGRDLDDGEVLFFVESQKARTVILACVEHDVALRAARDDVGVREDVAVLGEDDAGADHGAAVARCR